MLISVHSVLLRPLGSHPHWHAPQAGHTNMTIYCLAAGAHFTVGYTFRRILVSPDGSRIPPHPCFFGRSTILCGCFFVMSLTTLSAPLAPPIYYPSPYLFCGQGEFSRTERYTRTGPVPKLAASTLYFMY